MTYIELINYYGSDLDIAYAIKVTTQCVDYWKKQKKIPRGKQFEFEVLTNGKLKAERDS